MKNIYEKFAEHLLEHQRNNDESIRPIKFDGICPFCGSTMQEVNQSYLIKNGVEK